MKQHSGYMMLFRGEKMVKDAHYDSVRKRKEIIAKWESTVPFYYECHIQISPEVVLIEHPKYSLPSNARKYIKSHPWLSPSQLSKNLIIPLPEIKSYLRKHTPPTRQPVSPSSPYR